MHSTLIEEATALLLLKDELGPLYDVQKQHVLQRYVEHVSANAIPITIVAPTLKQLVQMNFIEAQELSQLMGSMMKAGQSKVPLQEPVTQQNNNEVQSFLTDIGEEAADDVIVPPPKFDYYEKYKKDGSLVDPETQKEATTADEPQKSQPLPQQPKTIAPSTSTPTPSESQATFASTPLPDLKNNASSQNNNDDILQNHRVVLVYAKPEVPAYEVDAPKIDYVKIQRKEILALKEHFNSLLELESPKPGTFCYEVHLAPFTGKDAKKNLVFVQCVVVYPRIYPYVAPEVTISSPKGLTPSQCKRLQNFTNDIAKRHLGHTKMMIVFREIKRWIMDVNYRMLDEKERLSLAYLFKPSFWVYPVYIVELDMFELEGKQKLLNIVATSIIHIKWNFWLSPLPLESLLYQIEYTVYGDPEFLLKLAYYVRHHLNIRSTANLLVAIAANYSVCHFYFPKYFCSIVRLPSDLLEVVNMYTTLPTRRLPKGSLPNVLRDSVKAKFKQFDEYQLGKYCSEANRKRLEKKFRMRKRKQQVDMQVEKYMVKDMKALIRKVHITEPRYYVMAIMGCKYPSTLDEFKFSKLPGLWDKKLAGKRMKLKTPVTWETQITKMGNSSDMWEMLLKEDKLPYMAMLRNLRNILKCGLPPNYHQMVIDKICNEEAVVKCRQFPFAFLSAYNAVNIDLVLLAKIARLSKRNRKKEKQRRKRDVAQAKRWGVAPPTHKESKREKKFKQKLRDRLKVQQIIIPKRFPSPKILADYQKAVEKALRISAKRNLPSLTGRSVILIDVSGSMQIPITYRFLQYSSKTNPPTRLDVAMLLGLMIHWCCYDHSDMYIFSTEAIKVKVDKSKGILWNVNEMKKIAQGLQPWSTNFPWESIHAMHSNQAKYDRMVLVSDMMITSGYLHVPSRPYVSPLVDAIKKYRDQVNKDFKFVMIDVSGSGTALTDQDEDSKDPRDMFISGFSDQILRFLQCQDSQMDIVENIDQELKKADPNNNNNND